MNEEEKEAIKEVKEIIDSDYDYPDILNEIKETNYGNKNLIELWNAIDNESSTYLKYSEFDIAKAIVYLVNLVDKQQKEIEFYKMQELEYIAGYEDGKSHKQTAVAIRNENAQYELIRRYIEELKEKYSKKLIEFQKEIEEYKKNYISRYTIEYLLDDYISKDKIRKLKGLVHKTLDDNGITRGYQLTIDNYFNEILGE